MELDCCSFEEKNVSSSESEYEADEYVQDTIPAKRFVSKKTCVAVLEKHAERWKYVDQRRIALERELGKDFSKYR